MLEAGADGTHGLAVELKISKNTMSGTQLAWFASARAKGWRCEAVWSLAEFVTLVDEHTGVIFLE